MPLLNPYRKLSLHTDTIMVLKKLFQRGNYPMTLMKYRSELEAIVFKRGSIDMGTSTVNEMELIRKAIRSDDQATLDEFVKYGSTHTLATIKATLEAMSVTGISAQALTTRHLDVVQRLFMACKDAYYTYDTSSYEDWERNDESHREIEQYVVLHPESINKITMLIETRGLAKLEHIVTALDEMQAHSVSLYEGFI